MNDRLVLRENPFIMKKLLTFTLLLSIATTFYMCSKGNSGSNLRKIEGTLYKNEMITTYQYGTYGVGEYALRSETIDLEDFVGEDVIVEGSPIEGYPIENGPEYLEVKSIEKKH